jgi:hypothetical protein
MCSFKMSDAEENKSKANGESDAFEHPASKLVQNAPSNHISSTHMSLCDVDNLVDSSHAFCRQ